jgi:hypothetical protein
VLLFDFAVFIWGFFTSCRYIIGGVEKFRRKSLSVAIEGTAG